MDALKIYSNNFLKYAQAQSTSDLKTLKYAFDNNSSTAFMPGSNSVTIHFYFNNSSYQPENKTLSALLLERHNVDTCVFTAHNANGNVVFTETWYPLQANQMHELPHIPASYCTLQLFAANTYNLRITKMAMLSYILTPDALTDTEITPVRNSSEKRMYDGSVMHFSTYRKKEFKIKMQNLPKEDYDLIYAAVGVDEELTISFWQDWEPLDMYECYVNPELKKTVDRRTALIECTLEGQEL